MPLKLDIKKKLSTRSERVKSVDLHPELPWVLAALYSGYISIFDYSNQSTVKSFEVSSNSPVRTAKFVVRKQWVITGSDDLLIRVFNYNTMEKVKTLEGHTDFIRSIVIHPTQPYIISTGDDATIKIWDWDNNFNCIKTLEEHVHFVMMLSINPRDLNTFASASLDKTIKIWSLTSTGKANFTLQGHQSGVNCVDYFKGDKPYLISGGDDKLIKIWDYQTKQCIQTLEGHQHNISGVLFHPDIPIIVTTSEDCSVKIWHANTYRLEMTLNYNMERVWYVDVAKDGSNSLAFAYDEGTVVVKIGSDEPIASISNGKVIWAKNLDIQHVNLKAINVNDEEAIKDGEKINVQVKDLGVSDIFPQAIRHAPNGHTFVISSDDEYSILRSQTFKNVAFGTGSDFVWSSTGDYAVREQYNVKIFKGATNAQQISLKTDFPIEGLFGGPILGVRSSDFVIFYDWQTAKIIRKIELSPKKIYWSDSTSLVVLATAEDFYVLNYNAQAVAELLEASDNEDGIEESFELSHEFHDIVTSGVWINDCFFFTNSNGKINYMVNGKIFNHATADKAKFILGYIQSQNRLYLIDKQFNIISYEVLNAVTEYQSAIAAKDFDKATEIEGTIDVKYYDKLARFLDQIDLKEEAFRLAQDPDHKFELAIQLNRIQEAFSIAKQEKSNLKWKQIGDLALISGKIDLAIECFEACDDLSGLLLIYTSLGLKDKLRALAKRAEDLTKANIAFACYFQLCELDNCIDILVKSKRISEAAFFAKTYCPTKIPGLVQLWKEDLQKSHPVASQKIANPLDYPEQFEDLELCMKIEEFIYPKRKAASVPAHQYLEYNELLSQDLFTLLKENPEADLSEVKIIPEIQEENPLLAGGAGNDEDNE